MRALLPTGGEPVDLHSWYASDWVDSGGIRADMIAGLDGASSADGLTAGLQTDGDNRVFAALRDLADVVLVGWSTARSEGYGPIVPKPEAVARRAVHGFAPALPVALVSRSLSMDNDSALLTAPGTIVITTAASDPDRRADLAARVDVVVCGDDDIDYAAVRAALADRGLTRVLCEGGPTILAQLIASGALDELCLTTTPFATGPGAGRIVAGEPWAGGQLRSFALHGLLEEDGALFARYVSA